MSQNTYEKDILPLRTQLLHTARKILEDDQEAEDAVQEVLLKLWRISNSLHRYANPAAVANTAIKNHCLDRIRQKKRESLVNDYRDVDVQNDNPHLQLERKDSEEIVIRIINELPKLQQMIITLKDVERYEVEEIAQITGSKPEAIRVNLARARKTVRERYIKLSAL